MTRPSLGSPPLFIWWVIWAAIATGLLILYVALGKSPSQGVPGVPTFLPIMPLGAAIIIRWLVIPRLADRRRAFPAFIVGMALAEACGISGLLLVPEMKDTYVLLGALGIMQFAPFFAARMPSSGGHV